MTGIARPIVLHGTSVSVAANLTMSGPGTGGVTYPEAKRGRLQGSNMIPFFVLLISTLLLRLIGMAGVRPFERWIWCLRCGLALMFLLTASAHWGKRRVDLIAMVPRVISRPALMVSITGVLEILGGLGLLFPPVASIAAACLAMLLIGLFPANIRAAREHLTMGGRPATALPLRALLQVVFVAALFVAGFPGVFRH